MLGEHRDDVGGLRLGRRVDAHEAGDLRVLASASHSVERAAHAEPGDDDLLGPARRGAAYAASTSADQSAQPVVSMSSIVVPWPGRRGSSTWKPSAANGLGEAAHRRRVAGEAVEHERARAHAPAVGSRAWWDHGSAPGRTAGRRATSWRTFYLTDVPVAVVEAATGPGRDLTRRSRP